MVELDAAQVLSIPRRLKCTEVVRRGFMSNFLFQNIGNIFGAPGVVTEIIKKLTPAQEEGPQRNAGAIDRAGGVPLNDDGEVEIPPNIVIGRTQDLFGDKIYGELNDYVEPLVSRLASPASGTDEARAHTAALVDKIKEAAKEKVIAPALEKYGVTGRTRLRIEKEITGKITDDFNRAQARF